MPEDGTGDENLPDPEIPRRRGRAKGKGERLTPDMRHQSDRKNRNPWRGPNDFYTLEEATDLLHRLIRDNSRGFFWYVKTGLNNERRKWKLPPADVSEIQEAANELVKRVTDPERSRRRQIPRENRDGTMFNLGTFIIGAIEAIENRRLTNAFKEKPIDPDTAT